MHFWKKPAKPVWLQSISKSMLNMKKSFRFTTALDLRSYQGSDFLSGSLNRPNKSLLARATRRAYLKLQEFVVSRSTRAKHSRAKGNRSF
jgi:hypothetical protein